MAKDDFFNVAVSIIGPTEEDALRDSHRAISEGANLIEIRRDCFDELNLSRLIDLCHSAEKPVIFTCRHKAEAGPGKLAGFQGSERERKRLFEEACVLGVDYIDMEHAHSFYTGPLVRESKIIRSHHDFVRTPVLADLWRMVEEIGETRPYLIKIATMARKQSDNLSVLSLLDNISGTLESNGCQGILGMTMGPLSSETRVYGPQHGAEWVYACLGDKKSAPGQLSVRDLKSIWGPLGLAD